VVLSWSAVGHQGCWSSGRWSGDGLLRLAFRRRGALVGGRAAARAGQESVRTIPPPLPRSSFAGRSADLGGGKVVLVQQQGGALGRRQLDLASCEGLVR
jgi:hypothetical protein